MTAVIDGVFGSETTEDCGGVENEQEISLCYLESCVILDHTASHVFAV